MSRSGYQDDLDPLDLGRWRGQVASAIRGKRGQLLLRDLIAALDAMPEKALIAHELIKDGQVCALGAVGSRRKIDMSVIDAHDPYDVGEHFNIASQLASEIVCVNDEMGSSDESPEQRYKRVYEWAQRNLAVKA